MKNKYTRSQRKHIRKEKARIRGEFSNPKKQAEAVKKLFDKVSGKLHVHSVLKSATKSKKRGAAPKAVKEGKRVLVAKKEIRGTMKEEKTPVIEDIKSKHGDPSSAPAELRRGKEKK